MRHRWRRSRCARPQAHYSLWRSERWTASPISRRAPRGRSRRSSGASSASSLRRRSSTSRSTARAAAAHLPLAEGTSLDADQSRGQAPNWADAARRQDGLWPFLEAFFANQGQENSGYVTKAFLTDLAKAAGVDANAAASHDATAAIDAANTDAQRLGVTGTPTFVVDGRIVSADELFAVLDR